MSDHVSLVVFAVSALAVLFFAWPAINLWLKASASRHPVGFFNIIFMRFRGTDPKQVVNAYITLSEDGRNIPIEKLEAHYLARGALDKLVRIMLETPSITFEEAVLKDFEEASG